MGGLRGAEKLQKKSQGINAAPVPCVPSFPVYSPHVVGKTVQKPYLVLFSIEIIL